MVEYSDFPDELPLSKRRSMKRVRAVSNLLDEAFRIPSTNYRIGLDPILGLLPVGGDAAAAVISLYVVLEAYLMDVPRHVLARMVMNILVDTLGGVIPILGSVFDAAWKANSRNLELLERHVEQY
ncbi:DUF4112 domain-containing protein [Haladaptatus sp. NG-SE-30]